MTASTTFLSVSAAVQSVRPPAPIAFACATRDSIVGVPGVWTTVSGPGSAATGACAVVTTASTFAAYPQDAHDTYVSSPTGECARNSSEAAPPMAPPSARTTV